MFSHKVQLPIYVNILVKMSHKWSFCVKGVEQFQKALEISPQSVSAEYGLASGLLGLAKECINLGAFRWGASLLEVGCLQIIQKLSVSRI